MRPLCFALIILLLGNSGIAIGQNVSSANPARVSPGPQYRNEALGMQISLPAGWYISNPQELELFIDKARKELKEEYKLSKGWIVHNRNVENVVLSISKQPIGTRKNSAFGFGVTKQPSDKITATMVAEATKVFFLKSAENSLAKDISIRKINGHEFAIFDMDVVSKLGKQHVRVLIVNIKSQAITFALTYWDNPDDLALMMMAIESVQFSA